MSPSEENPPVVRRSDEANWAKSVSHLELEDVAGAVNLNVAGRRLTSPIQGFGQMWQKTYRINLGDAVDHLTLIKTWRERFPEFWPKGNKFYGSVEGIAPGDVALLNLAVPGHLKISTGVLVLYSDDESFAFLTPEGHQFAGFITFSGIPTEEGTVAQVEVLVRASDPIYEIGMVMRIQGKMEDRFWFRTLTAVGRHFGVADVPIDLRVVCVDRKRQWRNWKNLRHNAFLRTTIYLLGAPVRWIAGRLKRS